MEIPSKSIFKILLLLRFLLEESKDKNEIVESFLSYGLKVNKPSINRYISILSDNGIKIEISKKKNKTVYSVKKPLPGLLFERKELLNIKNFKKRLFSYKNYDLIRRTMRLFYKIALFVDDIKTRENLLDFGYFSMINWGLVLSLEKHCKNKDIIEIEYITSDNKIKNLILHPDSISIAKSTTRLYLNCVLKDEFSLSHLPVDKIFVIKKVIRNKAPFNLLVPVVRYKVSTSVYNELERFENEKIIKQDSLFTVLEAPIRDEFYIIRRLLSFCPELYYISNSEIKNKVIEKLNLIKAGYNEQ